LTKKVIPVAVVKKDILAVQTPSVPQIPYQEKLSWPEILWAYSSRMVRDWIKARSDIELKPRYQVLSDLWAKGHQWAVVQSMHLINLLNLQLC